MIKRNKSGVYIIENSDSHRVYIGSASNLRNRKSAHFSSLKLGNHGNKHLQRAFIKYGASCFTFSVLEYCGKHLIREVEQGYIDSYDFSTLYNIFPTVDSSKGYAHSDESKKKISLAHSWLGRKHSKSTKDRISRNNGKSREVMQICMITGDVLRIHPSSSSAGRYVNNECDSTGVSACCTGKQKSAYGFYWQYV